jgi:Purine catabolism regulatory protein-like family/PucR C-terminal helix-turn-helix domain/GGDEF-like domain
MTLGDLLRTRGGRELRLVAGGEAALERPVRGVHSTEMDHPTLWIERDWVVLTSGLRLKRQPDRQRRLIAELHDAKVTALGFGIGSAFSVVPRALLDEARRMDFPVFVVPWDVSFRDMIRDVYEGLLSDDVRVYLRLVSMQHQLLDALADEAPQDTVIERLAWLAGATVAVLAPGGRIVRATGELPAAAFWEQLSDHTPMVTEFDADGWHGVAVPLPETSGAATRWLVVGAREAGFNSGLTKRVAQITAPLLAAMGRIDAAARDQERQIKTNLLETLLESTNPNDERMLRARARAFGIRMDGASRVVAIVRHEGEGDEAFLEAVETAAEGLGLASLVRDRDGVVTVLAEPVDGARWDELLAGLARHLGDCSIGAGRAIGSVADVRQSRKDAALAMRRAQELEGAQALAYESLELDAWLVGEVPRERWIAKVEALVQPLRDNPQLRDTVAAYFASDLDVVRTAEVLHLHPNSLRYRLRRVEALLGRPLRRPSTIAALQFALLALGDELRGHSAESPR